MVKPGLIAQAALKTCLPVLLAAGSAAAGDSAGAAPPASMPDWPPELSGEPAGSKRDFDSEPEEKIGAGPRPSQTAEPQNDAADEKTEAADTDGVQGEETPLPAAAQTPDTAGGSLDPVTAERMEVLRSTGLIARQSAIAESIIIMERQLRQAGLIQELMAIYGPDAPIEIAPGEYKTFADTPAGRKIAAEIEEAESLARIRLLELKAAEADLNGRDPSVGEPLPASIENTAGAQPADDGPDWPEFHEILGMNGEFRASFLVDGVVVTAAPGDRLPDGTILAAVSGKSALLRNGGNEREIRLGW